MTRTAPPPTESTSEPTPRESEEVADTESETPSRRWIRWLLLFLLVAAAGGLVWWEATTSRLQALYFSEMTDGADWHVADGPSTSIHFPQAGPFDRRLGYVQLPATVDRLTDGPWRILRQARMSPEFLELLRKDVFPPYIEKQRAGLALTDVYNQSLHRARYPTRVYDDFEAIPEVVVDTLLFVENRALLDPQTPRRNPAVEADRLARALGEFAWSRVTDGERPDGGSTLATQIEKFRHSPGGLTANYADKYQQMLSASVRAYLHGPNTTDEQRHIVLTYLNSVPLASVDGFGEVFGLGDGLYAWYGADFETVNRQLGRLADEAPALDAQSLQHAGRAYRRVLSLIVAQRRPTWYLGDGRDRLSELTDLYLRRLREADVIPAALADAAQRAAPRLQDRATQHPDAPFRHRKLPYSLRTDLLDLVGAENLYALDRLDLSVETTVDVRVQRNVESTLRKLDDPAFIDRHKLDRWRLLHEGDPSEIIYSLTLYERGPEANLLRIQADTFEGPFNVNEGVKLNLGSTAKLRTTISYLQIVADLWDQMAGLAPEEISPSQFDRRDRISRWVARHLKENRYATLEATLQAAMQRRYSADPDETFFTGGGVHRFRNFSYKYNDQWPTVRKGLKKSINLVFIRLMRDLVRYHMFRMPGSDPAILSDADHPRRRHYLERFADREGVTFLRRFYDKYDGFAERARLIRLVGKRWRGAEELGAIHRSVYPDADVYTFNHFLKEQLGRELPFGFVKEMYRDLSPDVMELNDRGYVADVHPLELWLVRYLRDHPAATFAEVKAASGEARQTAYEWLYRTSRKSAQDQRIRIMLERDAFGQIHTQWKKLGYPFDRLVPSYASALGSSADRPAALSELVGIILNDGRRKPRVQFRSLTFAEDTPFETVLRREPTHPRQVLREEVAGVAKDALIDVVRDGTAKRLTRKPQVAAGPNDDGWVVGGKTGTGDNRHEIRNSRGRLIKSIPQNRTATFTFFLDDRFYGALTAYVPGKQSGDYRFTSSLAVEVLGLLAPDLAPLWHRRPDGPPADERHRLDAKTIAERSVETGAPGHRSE